MARFTHDWQAERCLAIFDRSEIVCQLDDTHADRARSPEEMERQARIMVDALNAAEARAAPSVKRFEIGRTYSVRSVADHECIHAFEILDRTEKSVTVEVRGERVRRGLKVIDGVEQFKPFGTYSMCAVIRAEVR